MTEIVFDPKQQEAIDACCDIDKRIVAVTGPAGTGKTLLIKTIHNNLKEAGYMVGLGAPTGKAAKRIYESTGIDAMTLHRLLEYNHPGDPDPKTGKPIGFSSPKRTRANPLELDVVLVDEAAMMNDEIYRNLIDALPRTCIIRFFGDDNQLAPIENDKRLEGQPSPFLKILRDEKNFYSVKLETVFRQGEDSGILLNANTILKSRIPVKNDQWSMKTTDLPVDNLRQYVLDSLQEGIDYAKIENQIIVPSNKSWVGTVKLNLMMQSLYHNELDPCLKLDRHAWEEGEFGKGSTIRVHVGDKVICTTNQYDLGVFNGETGIVKEIDEDTGEVLIDFGDREQSFPPTIMVMNQYGKYSAIDPRRSLALAYVITTHKSQGSEFKRVIYILNKSNFYMINRRNFYTAVTRAREHVHIICDQKSLSHAVYNKG